MRRTFATLGALGLAAAITLVSAAPAQAAPARANGQANPVILVHGFNWNANTDCGTYWAAAKTALLNDGWTGGLTTYGYYSGDTNCGIKYSGGTGTSIKTVAKDFATQIYNRYSVRGVKVDVLAHSMGGLVVRSALTETAKGTTGFPPYLYIEDVATLSTPHGGANYATLCYLTTVTQCKEMAGGSSFLTGLQARPQSAMSTDWTTLSSYDDPVVYGESGSSMNAQHKIEYSGGGLDHDEMKTAVASYRARYYHASSGTWSAYGTRVGPLPWAANALQYHSTT